MGIWKHARRGGLVVTGGALLLVMAFLLTWGHRAGTPVEADTPHPGLNFSLTVPDVDGCDTTAGDATCYIEPGSAFTLEVSLDSLPDGVDDYEGFDLAIEYTGVTSADNASTGAWPDCGFPASFFRPGFVAMGCVIGVPPAGPSTYTGLIGTNDFTCTESGSISLKHGEANTFLLETVSLKHAEGVDTRETLAIVCGGPPTPTATPVPPTATAAPPAAPPPVGSGTSGGGVDAGLWAIIGALLTAGAAVLAVSGWKAARGR